LSSFAGRRRDAAALGRGQERFGRSARRVAREMAAAQAADEVLDAPLAGRPGDAGPVTAPTLVPEQSPW
jgi:hypothetical protein